MKVLDVASLREGIHATLQEIEKVQSQLSRVQRGIRDIIALDHYLKGQTGEAIRSFYKQLHEPFLIYVHQSLTDYAEKLKNIEQAIQSYEPDENGLIRREFLDYHIKRGLDRTEDIASDLVAQANKEIASIADLVSLPRLDMSELSFVVQKGRHQTRQIANQLHELDHTQTKNLAEIKGKLNVMKQYTSEMKRTFNLSGQTLNPLGLPPIFYLPTLPTILKSIYGEPEVEEEKEDNFLVKGLKIAGDSIKGAGIGLFDVGKDTVVGLYETVTDPKGTLESLYHSVTNPVETYKYIEKAIVDSYERDMINGDAESRSHWVAYALGTTVTAVVGTKGAGTITKTGVATTKAGAKKAVETAKHLDLSELLPYSSKYQVATVNNVPHGVVDGSKLLQNRLFMAEKLTDSGGGLKGSVKGISKSLDSVPSVRNGEFRNWFNSLTIEEFDKVWGNPKLRESVKDRLRHPGGLHEWHLVSRADKFKYWGVTAEQIAEMRTLISETRFVNPNGKHGGKGSTKAHNELLQIIDTSKDYNMFKRRLQNWSDYRFEGGSDALPEGLNPKRR